MNAPLPLEARPGLQSLLPHPALWRGADGVAGPVLASGHALLDGVLPGGGWGVGQVSELLHRPGHGELTLLFPALRQLTAMGRSVVLVAPPWPPYAPAWAQAGIALERLVWIRPANPAEAMWAMEQALADPAPGAVLGWHAGMLADRAARRLQLAARQGTAAAFLLRHAVAQSTASPFPLRLAVAGLPDGWRIRVLKRRGLPLTAPVDLSRDEVHDALAGVASAPAGAGCVPASTARLPGF
ncbi:translesion DNA synthesis-associated protein ImuA [Chitiniphilus purpureus]|uniref:Translesion DNA synthesis-associated protein ImuA n=1 Tax=Chitiniphilus purpureus TaxID=2981137 RepID=A0ABY6DM03_9NEIS|nr:translesion DNA synthesis-associated protein ImuA [Chitiniphilus sp. CD1]UXY15379.1 translesion DNA synthesis-associated protein ImuA [Chitiniphilus sp. CD1]